MSRLRQYYRLQRTLRLILTYLFTFSLVIGWAGFGWVLPAQGQLPSLSTAGINDPLTPPPEVTRHGEFETAPVRSPLDNQVLFEVTSPTVWNRDKVPEHRIPAEVRAEEVNDRLWRVLNRTLQAKQMLTVSISTLNHRPILEISDGLSSRPVRLITVTEPDAEYNGQTLKKLAQTWQQILQAEMGRMKQFSSPKLLRDRLQEAGQILLGLVVASGMIWVLRRLLTRRQQTLEAAYQNQLAAIVKAETTGELMPVADSAVAGINSSLTAGEETEVREIADMRSRFLAGVQHQFSVKRRLDLDKFLKWALLWISILMWYLGIYQIMSRIPILMRWSFQVLATPLVLILLWFGVSFTIRISKSLIDRLVHSWKANPYLSIAEVQRSALRATTLAGALKGLVTFVAVSVGMIWTLSLFNIPTSSILAGGAIIGLAISFGSQSLIKDLVNGCLILIEDQFAIGDVIQIGDKSGLVENLNLRITQLRNGEGQLITIPNSNIIDIRNLTRLWSRVDFSIVVAYENDPKHVLAVLNQVAQELYSEPVWRDRLVEPPDVLGIDELSHHGMLVRVWIKTIPMEQWSVGREFRLRVRLAFELNKIQIGRPQWITYNTDFANADN